MRRLSLDLGQLTVRSFTTTPSSPAFAAIETGAACPTNIQTECVGGYTCGTCMVPSQNTVECSPTDPILCETAAVE